MSTIVNATTVEARADGPIIKYKFRYTLDTGGVYEQRAWVSPSVSETSERDKRGQWLLESLAEQEAGTILNV